MSDLLGIWPTRGDRYCLPYYISRQGTRLHKHRDGRYHDLDRDIVLNPDQIFYDDYLLTDILLAYEDINEISGDYFRRIRWELAAMVAMLHRRNGVDNLPNYVWDMCSLGDYLILKGEQEPQIPRSYIMFQQTIPAYGQRYQILITKLPIEDLIQVYPHKIHNCTGD